MSITEHLLWLKHKIWSIASLPERKHNLSHMSNQRRQGAILNQVLARAPGAVSADHDPTVRKVDNLSKNRPKYDLIRRLLGALRKILIFSRLIL